MQPAWRLQWQHAQRCLKNESAVQDRTGLDCHIPLTNEFKMDIARLEIPVSG